MNLHDIISEHKRELILVFSGSLISTIVMVFIIGRKHMTWLVKELVKMYSANEQSYFSKKRVDSGQAFYSALIIMLGYIFYNWEKLGNSEMIADVTILFLIAGYNLKKIQEEKKMNMDDSNGSVDNSASDNSTEKQ